MTDTAGDPACWLSEVCAECGAIPDPEAGHGCVACLPPVRLADAARRFARVKRDREDKDAKDADVIGSLQALLPQR